MNPEFVSTTAALQTFLDLLVDCEGLPPSLYIDLEGDNLSRHGSLALMTILFAPEEKIYIVDVTQLTSSAFSVAGSRGRTLRAILESPDIVKVFFDIRNDSDALFSLYDIHVAGIEDLQLMELASRSRQKRCVNGLAKCVEYDAGLTWSEKLKWQQVKDTGRKLFDPARGGSYKVFEQRPLRTAMMEYCCQDVILMPKLRAVYRSKLCDAWWVKIQQETQSRILLSQSADYNGQGRHMAMGPPGWLNWQPNATERMSRSLVASEPARQRRSQLVQATPRAEDGDGPRSLTQDDSDSSNKLSLPPARNTTSQGTISATLAKMTIDTSVGSDDDSNSGRHQYFYSPYDDDAGGVGDDFTACDKDECGYCGKCSY